MNFMAIAAGAVMFSASGQLFAQQRTCPDDTAEIAAGTFTMGAPDREGDVDEHPRNRVRSQSFCLDETEVTVAAYRRCVDADRCEQPHLFDEVDGDLESFCTWGHQGFENHPVNCVSWRQARNFCSFVHGRLPTEAEWEFAARGAANLRFPWGNEAPDQTRANLCGRECQTAGRSAGFTSWVGIENWTDAFGLTAPVGSFPAGNTPAGVQDMAGNVWEWVLDAYRPHAYDRVDVFPAQRVAFREGDFRVIRGGGWRSHYTERSTSTIRSISPPEHRSTRVGFRCVRNYQ